MSANLTDLYGQQFASAVELKLQQEQSLFRPLVMEGMHKGEQASPVDQIGQISMSAVDSRFSPIVRTDAPVDRRWVTPSPFSLAQQVDSFDKLKVLSDPMNKYVQNAVAAANRTIDDVIVDAFYGTAKTGKSGSTSTSFASGNEVAVNYGASGDVGLSVKKLRRVKKLAFDNKVDPREEWYCAISPQAHDDLLAEVQVVSVDYNDRPVLVDGFVKRFLGINFIIYTDLPTSSGDRRIPLWVKSGMHLGLWEDNIFSIDKRVDLESQPWQVYNKMMIGATRTQENKCYSILCNE